MLVMYTELLCLHSNHVVATKSSSSGYETLKWMYQWFNNLPNVLYKYNHDNDLSEDFSPLYLHMPCTVFFILSWFCFVMEITRVSFHLKFGLMFSSQMVSAYYYARAMFIWFDFIVWFYIDFYLSLHGNALVLIYICVDEFVFGF